MAKEQRKRSHATGLFRSVFKFLVSIFAILLIIIGIIVAPSPIPFGIIFISIGFLLLSASAPDLIRWLRRRWRWFDRQLKKLEAKAPRWLARQLHRSDIGEIDKDEEPQAAT